MLKLRFALAALLAGGLCIGGALAQPPVNKDLATATQEVEQQEAAFAKARGRDKDAFYAENLLDMHTSGWLYDKQGGIDVITNGNLIPGVGHAIKNDTTKRQVVAFSRDMVTVVYVQTMYYAVPDPEELAEQQGIKTLDPAAVAKARANPPPAPLPGERYAPNPYRARYIRIWLRDPKTAKWQIAISAAAKITARTLPGRYPEIGMGTGSQMDR